MNFQLLLAFTLLNSIVTSATLKGKDVSVRDVFLRNKRDITYVDLYKEIDAAIRKNKPFLNIRKYFLVMPHLTHGFTKHSEFY